MKRILLTGFDPFDGRERNASWIAARALAGAGLPELELRAVLIPVCWNAPRAILTPILEEWQPDCVIGMGEGEPGIFRLETRARNTRRERPDNNGRYPEGEVIDMSGPDFRVASARFEELLSHLSERGIPVRVSDDAGAFLCEELLYTLEGLRNDHDFLHTVLFVHLPPHGTALQYRNESRICDELLLLDFGQSLLGYLANATAMPEGFADHSHST